MIQFIFLIIVFVFVLLGISFAIKSYALGLISAMAMMIIGVYIAINGIIGIDNILTQALAVSSIGIGAYVFIYGSIQQFEEV